MLCVTDRLRLRAGSGDAQGGEVESICFCCRSDGLNHGSTSDMRPTTLSRNRECSCWLWLLLLLLLAQPSCSALLRLKLSCLSSAAIDFFHSRHTK